MDFMQVFISDSGQWLGSLWSRKLKEIFSKKKISEYLNKTLIALFPKIQGPKTLGNYCPISLCNIVYKVIMKIIVARIRLFLYKLIFPLQTAFVPDIKGIDNVIII